MPEAMNYHRWLIALVTPWLKGKALEVGFGYGQYTYEIAGCVDELVAIDCDQECLENFKDRPDNVRLMAADLTDPRFAERVGLGAFDAIMCLNVLEHIADDLATLERFRQSLKPGGHLMLIVPAHPALYGSMDAMAGHYRRYTRTSLRNRFADAGYRIREVRYINPLGALGWWVNAKIVRPKDLSAPIVNKQILWYDRFVQPLSRFLSPLTCRIFGQSLWAVAERPMSVTSPGAA